ncbi:MAG TPA: SulP family inorganic anion transporter, partial [Chryseolinea sp.]|nr:SulP family inorganic anion transporter [Chryseolinea sp.]
MNSTKDTFASRLKFYMTPFDGRYEDLVRGNTRLNVMRDLTAGLIVAMVAIPLAMGFAMASGLEPEQGIVGGAVAGLLGALFGGSKYQVYGPTAAFIPVIAAVMAKYDHGFLALVSILAGSLLMIMGLFKFGKIVALVPHSIVVGFTIGIAIVIAFSQIGEVLGLQHDLGYNITEQIPLIILHFEDSNWYAVIIAVITFVLCKFLLRISIFIPAPLIAFAVALLLAETLFAGKGLILIKDEYGSIPTDFFVFTTPSLVEMNWSVALDILYFTFAIFFVAAIESLLCSRMADRLANNQGLPYNPNKELWGQGIVNIVTPLLNGFPHTGALARTAVNIKVGAISPLSGIAKFTFKLLLAAFLASYLEHVPMACIGGILLYVAHGMVKKVELREVLSKNWFHRALMFFTAAMVPLFGFLIGVLSAIILYVALFKYLDRPAVSPNPVLSDNKGKD